MTSFARTARTVLVLLALGGPALARTPSLVGVWRAVVPDAYGAPAAVELVFTGNTYSQTTQSAAQRVYMAGTYQTTSAGLLRWTIRQAFPREQCSTVGCSPIYWPDAESYTFALRGDTLVMNHSSCAQTPCPIAYRRVR